MRFKAKTISISRQVYDSLASSGFVSVDRKGNFVFNLAALFENYDSIDKQVDRLSGELEEKNIALQKKNSDLEGLQNELARIRGSKDDRVSELMVKQEAVQQGLKKLRNRYERLKDRYESMKTQHGELYAQVLDYESVIGAFNSFGTYQSLCKKAAIVNFFVGSNQEYIRQKTVTQALTSVMRPITCRKYLYELVELGVLQRHHSFRGTYRLASQYMCMAEAIAEVVEVLVGSDLFKLMLKGIRES